jgi:hypothetical protein
MENTLQSIDYQEWRRRIAGLLDQDTPLSENANEEMRDLSSRLACLLAEVFGHELERLTLWSRIDSALKTACSKVTDGNMEMFLNHCLEHVKADPVRVCSNETVGALLTTLSEKPLEWRMAFTRYITTRIYAVLVHGREAWNWKKLESKVERGKV